MNPTVVNKTENDDTLYFTLNNANVSIANAIRRTILSEIPVVVFRTLPETENKCTIIKNKSRFTNEMLKQRLQCVPVIMDTSVPYGDYSVEINVKNNTDQIQFVTTEHFIVKNKTTGEQISKTENNKVFPKNPISGSHILFARLMPGSDKTNGDEIHIVSDLDIGIAKESGSYSVVSLCSYSNTVDPVASDSAWQEKKTRLLEEQEYSNDELDALKKNWDLLDGQRYFLQNSFDFKIQTVGYYSNESLIIKACDVVQNKIEIFNKQLQTKTVKLEKSNTTIDNCYDITLEGEDYTLGKVLEYVLYSQYYEGDSILSYCGFKKFHPHDNDSIIRIAFKNNETMPFIFDNLISVCNIASKQFDIIKAQFGYEAE